MIVKYFELKPAVVSDWQLPASIHLTFLSERLTMGLVEYRLRELSQRAWRWDSHRSTLVWSKKTFKDSFLPNPKEFLLVQLKSVEWDSNKHQRAIGTW
jgi:hypothetical protein